MAELFNADMMIMARQVRGFSQTELAKLLNISQSKVSKIEAGYMQPGEPVSFAEQLATILQFRPSFFLRDGRLRPAPANYHRKRKKLSATEWERILARSEIYRMSVDLMMRSVELAPSKAPPPAIDLDQYDRSVERVAQAVRQFWMLPRGPIVDVTKLIEDCGILIIPFDFGTELIDAFCQHAVDHLPPLIFINTRMRSKDRMRYSLLHELGHLVCHRLPHPGMEDEANQFAAAFLMPADEIRPSLHGMSMEKLMMLKLHWKASMQAILLRGRDLGRLSDHQYRYYQIELSRRGWRSAEPVDIEANETPAVFRKLLTSHLNELSYTPDELSELFGVFPSEMPELIGPPDRPRLRLVT